MNSLVTHGIQISVQPEYNSQYSKPNLDQHIFVYYVTIENVGTATMQLLRRHWVIQEFLGPVREVDGEGVIGEQPVLQPSEKHEYNSFTDLRTDMGRMYGYYTFQNVSTGEMVEVKIPKFQLIIPCKLN